MIEFLDAPLAKRLLTAVVLIPLVVVVVLVVPSLYFSAIFAAFVLVGAWEWGGLMGWPAALRRAYALAFLPLLFLVYWSGPDGTLGRAIVGLGVLWWAVALLWIVRYQQGRDFPMPKTGIWRGALGGLVLLPSWTALVAVHGHGNSGPSVVLVLFLVIWAADSGAYFAGRSFGQRRLASRVSPGKTWEGIAGAVLASALVGFGSGIWLGLSVAPLSMFVVLCLAMVPVSVIGDLAESLFKRQAGVKDSGHLLPGHGGVLDRIDSLTAAAPFFALGWTKLGAFQ